MRSTRALIIASAVILGLAAAPTPATAGVSFDFFYSNLTPHGSWYASGQYGRVWRPVDYRPGWNPYLDGHWVYSDFGWTWVSDYDWGAIPYHYGTWVTDPAYGWVWVPGYTWAPSWVEFRTGPGYIGWAPVAPGFSVGLSFTLGSPAPGPFLFVPSAQFLAPSIRGCAVPYSRTTYIYNNTHVINSLVVQNDVVVNRGPDRSYVESVSGRRIQQVPIEQVSRTAPRGRFNRLEARVDPVQARHGLRAAAGVPGRSAQSLPRSPASHGYAGAASGRSSTTARPRISASTAPASPVRNSRSTVRAIPSTGSHVSRGASMTRGSQSYRGSSAVRRPVQPGRAAMTPARPNRAGRAVAPARPSSPAHSISGAAAARRPMAQGNVRSARGNEKASRARVSGRAK